MAYVAHGSGPPLIVVPNPATSCELLWDHPRVAAVLRRLASFARLIVFDPIGSGSSDPMSRDPQVEDSVGQLDAIMDDAQVATAHLLASDLGCWGALMFAAVRPERVSGVILIDGTARLARDDDYPIGMPADILRYIVTKSVEQQGSGANVSVLAPSLAADVDVRDIP